MTNLKIKIWEAEFEFTWEILLKHMREIEPLTSKLQNKEIYSLDFIVWIASILCVSNNKKDLEDTLNNLNSKWIEDFTKDFNPLLESLNKNGSEKK